MFVELGLIDGRVITAEVHVETLAGFMKMLYENRKLQLFFEFKDFFFTRPAGPGRMEIICINKEINIDSVSITSVSYFKTDNAKHFEEARAVAMGLAIPTNLSTLPGGRKRQ